MENATVFILGDSGGKFTVYSGARRAFSGNSLLKSEYVAVINAECINIQTEKSNVTYFWKDIFACCEYDDLFIFFVSKKKAMYFPKKYFPTNQDIGRLRSLVFERAQRCAARLSYMDSESYYKNAKQKGPGHVK